MVFARVPSLRYSLAGAAPYLRASQRRWAQVHDVRSLVTEQSDRILQKYREKLDRKVKEEGLRDISELKEVYKEKIDHLKKKATIEIPASSSLLTTPTQPKDAASSPFPPPPPPPSSNQQQQLYPPSQRAAPSPSSVPTIPSTPGIPTLSSFLDLDKVRTLPRAELEAVWRLRHAPTPSSLCGAVPPALHERMAATARAHPHFILPLPRRGDGSGSGSGSGPCGDGTPAPPTEIHFLQWTFPAPDTVTVLFTHLADYKVRGEYAEPHTTVTHHLELAAEKGVVLMQGAVVPGRGVSVEEAKWLVMCLQRFYGGVGDGDGATEAGAATGDVGRRRRLLEMFARGDEAFRLEELVEEAEKIV